MNLHEFLRKIPKAELHVHLTGTVFPKTLQKLSHQSREYFNRFIGGCKTVEEIVEEETPPQGFGRFWIKTIYFSVKKCNSRI